MSEPLWSFPTLRTGLRGRGGAPPRCLQCKKGWWRCQLLPFTSPRLWFDPPRMTRPYRIYSSSCVVRVYPTWRCFQAAAYTACLWWKP